KISRPIKRRMESIKIVGKIFTNHAYIILQNFINTLILRKESRSARFERTKHHIAQALFWCNEESLEWCPNRWVEVRHRNSI
ncbi:PIPO, partial [Banana bract mosaic virus]|uniref:PIPO n=1 Tax=Banana bract mosaic virus TaxID=45661 RepID=UPI0002651570